MNSGTTSSSSAGGEAKGQSSPAGDQPAGTKSTSSAGGSTPETPAEVPANSQISVIRDVSEAGVTIRAAKLGRRANISELGHNQLGLIMFGVVTALVLSMLIFVGVYAWCTYPNADEIQKLLGPATADDPLGAATQAREQWANSVEHTAQLFIFGSLVPLLATIVGYALGERSGRSSDD